MVPDLNQIDNQENFKQGPQDFFVFWEKLPSEVKPIMESPVWRRITEQPCLRLDHATQSYLQDWVARHPSTS